MQYIFITPLPPDEHLILLYCFVNRTAIITMSSAGGQSSFGFVPRSDTAGCSWVIWWI